MKNLLDKVTEYFSKVSDEELDSVLKETEEYRGVYPYVKDYLSEFEFFNSEGCTESITSSYSCSYSDVEPYYDLAA